jgi:bifunctional DNase/RNase
MHRIDSRTSDAIAVALGHRCPIYVSTGVFDEAGVGAGAGGAPPPTL